MSVTTILLIVLVIILLGGLGGPYVNPGWRPGYGAGWYGNGLIGLVLLILVVWLLVGGRF
jgi:hypothetical protein